MTSALVKEVVFAELLTNEIDETRCSILAKSYEDIIDGLVAKKTAATVVDKRKDGVFSTADLVHKVQGYQLSAPVLVLITLVGSFCVSTKKGFS